MQVIIPYLSPRVAAVTSSRQWELMCHIGAVYTHTLIKYFNRY